MTVLCCGRLPALVAAILLAVGGAVAGPILVRVAAADYQELYDHIEFKGSSVTIAGAVPGESYDLVLEREDLDRVRSSGLPWSVVTDDLDTQAADAWSFGYYCDYDSLVRIMRNWAATYPTICRFDSIGQTFLGRWIYAVKISDNVHLEEDEPEVLMEATHHAREWAAPQAARHFGDSLLTSYGSDPAITDFVDNHQLWIIPVVNVDGYDYDYPQQRMWRLNRKPFGSAIGCDPNRDYNGSCDTTRMHAWGALVRGSRSTHYPGHETWFGARSDWAECVDALQQFFRERTFVADVTLHSYGELVIWPFSSGVAPYDQTIASLGQGMAAQMSRLSGGTYTPQQANYLYPSAGSSKDWMYGWAHNVGGFPCMSYTIELGTTFYQNTSQLPAIQTACFKGSFYLFSRADSIINALEGRVPPPVLTPLDSSVTGEFILHWRPVRSAYNRPLKWEVEELSGLSVIEDDFESGTGLWDLGGFSLSTTQRRSGAYSLYSGSANNISNYMVTRDPYPVGSGDSLTFWVWYDLENNYDVFVAEVSENGLEWSQLHDRYTGNSSGWQRKIFPLERWVGRSVYIRLRAMTDDNTLRNGVYVDDVCPVPLFDSRSVLSDNVTDTLYQVTGRTPGRYWYRVRGYNATRHWSNHGPIEDVLVTGTGVAGPVRQSVSTGLTLVGPNPSGGRAAIRYGIASTGPARVAMFDAAGREVRVLTDGVRPAGSYDLHWDGRDDVGRRLPAGVYYCRLSADTQHTVRIVRAR
ncbi:MAG: M14 family zinc carboxypeptidase [bacterium]